MERFITGQKVRVLTVKELLKKGRSEEHTSELQSQR